MAGFDLEPSGDPAPDVDLVAASLRAESADAPALVNALARKLELALPGRCLVDRRPRRFLSKEKVVHGVTVDLGDNRYSIVLHRGGLPEARRQTAVRGIVLKSEQLDVDVWIDALARELAEAARSSAQARQALERIVL